MDSVRAVLLSADHGWDALSDGHVSGAESLVARGFGPSQKGRDAISPLQLV